MVIAEFVLSNGGLVNEAVGVKFPGRKLGTWREVIHLQNNGLVVIWRNAVVARKIGRCSSITFYMWCDKNAQVIEASDVVKK